MVPSKSVVMPLVILVVSGAWGLPRPVQSREVSVKSFGAVGDGRHDDRPSIQQALDAAGKGGGTVLVPPGIYLLAPPAAGGPVLLVDSGVSLRGAGVASRLVLGPRARAYGSALGVVTNRHFLAKQGGADVRDHDIVIADLAFDGGASPGEERPESAYHGVLLVGVERVRVEACEFVNTQGKWSGTPSDGIYVTSTSTGQHRPGNTCRGVTIANCRFRDIGRDGITIVDGIDITIVGNIVERAHTRSIAKEGGDFGVGIDLEPNYADQHMEDITVKDNTAIDCYAGISAFHGNGPGTGRRVLFLGNRVIRSKDFGLRFDHVNDSVMEGNIVENCGNEGIIIDKSMRVDVRRNRLQGNAMRRPTVVASILVRSSQAVSIYGNSISVSVGSRPVIVTGDSSDVNVR